MMKSQRFTGYVLALVILVGFEVFAWGQGGPPPGRGPGQAGQRADMEIFHYLLSHRMDIQRTVKEIPQGVETITESAKPEVAARIQDHAVSMKARVEQVRPIHMRDPLFREIFRNAAKIDMKVEKTTHGVKVTETSRDPFVVRLIQAHAKVVSGFVANGHEEARKNHAVPPRDDAKK